MEQYQDGRPKRRLTEDYGDQKVSKRQNAAEHVGEWNENLHRSFVAAVFETGLKHASPSVIMEQMTLSMAAITSERVKSHLQKYRNNKEKNKAQFMEEYDGFMQKALTVGTAGGKVSRSNGGASTSFLTPEALVRMLGAESIIGGDLPALLTYAVMHDDGLPEPHQASSQMASSILTYPPQPHASSLPNLSINAIKSGSQEFTSYMSKQDGTKIPFPVLSEEERRSPLGESICHVMALFCSLTQQIVAERAKQGEESFSHSLPHVLSAEFRGDSDDENE